MLSTFSGHGKHGVRLAELSASLVFRHVRRRMMISSSSSSSTGEGGGERGMPEVGYQQEVFSIERIVDDALVAVYRNVGNTRWIRNSNVSATVCVVTNGRLVVGACGLPTVLLVSKSSRNGTVVELLTGRKMMSSAQVKQLEQQQQQQQEEMGCEGDERERERDKEEEGNDDEDDEEQGEKVVEVKQEEDKVKEGESKTNETTRTTGTGTVIVPKRRISRAKRNDDVNVGATNDNGDGDKQSSRIVLKQNSNNKLDIDIDIDIDDDDEDNDDDDVVEEISSDLEEEEEEGTCNVTDSDPSSSSSSRSSMTSRSFPRKHGVSMNDKVTRTSTSNKKRSHCPSQSYCQSNNSMGDDTMNQHSNNMLHTILVSSASTRTLTELCSSDDTTRATQLNMSIPQLHGRFSLPSVDNECETDESRRKTSMNNEGMVLGTCATPCIRSFELSCRHTHVIVSTTRLWAGDNEIAPQSISDVFAKAGSQTSVIDLAERVTEVAFGGCVPTHDTTVLCARLRKR